MQLAKESGAEFLVDSSVDKVEENSVILRNGDVYTAKVIVDAGGHNGAQ